MRTFVALLPSKKSVSALQSLGEAIPLKRQDTLVDPKKLHMTLVFCGDIDKEHVKNLSHLLVATEISSSFTLQPEKLAFFGHPKTKRLALEFQTTPLIDALHLITMHEMSRVKIPLDNSRKFQPHITLAKIKSRTTLPKISTLPTIEFTELVLFESVLSKTGSTFKPLIKLNLQT